MVSLTPSALQDYTQDSTLISFGVTQDLQVSPQAVGINPDIVVWDLSKKLVVYTKLDEHHYCFTLLM